jgi:hypothetical protein
MNVEDESQRQEAFEGVNVRDARPPAPIPVATKSFSQRIAMILTHTKDVLMNACGAVPNKRSASLI